MRIIERGEVEKTWPRAMQIKCCQSVLEIEPTDIKRDSDYTGGFNGYYIDCPVCGGQPEISTAVQAAGQRWLRQQERIAQSGVE